MSGTALVEQGADLKAIGLDELAATVRREHGLCVGAMRTTLQHAIRAGEALLLVRQQTLPNGKWMAWLDANFPAEKKSVYRYMRIAHHKNLIPADLGVQAADELVRGLPTIDGGPSRRRVTDVRKDDARRLRREGLSYKEIAGRLSVSVSSVYGWINGGTKGQREKRARKALRHQEKQRAVKQAVTKAGGAVSEAYAMAERLDDVLGQAHREATDSESRRDIARAHEFHRAMRDSIVRALGVET